jgi:AraC-like DNA-binding protein
VCAVCRERERSRRRRENAAFREEHRRLCAERYERLRSDDPDGYRAMLDQAAGRQREARANGVGPRLREQDRRRYWRARTAAGGLTLEELAERTGHPRELLARVLADEASDPPRRVWLDRRTGATGSSPGAWTRRRSRRSPRSRRDAAYVAERARSEDSTEDSTIC